MRAAISATGRWLVLPLLGISLLVISPTGIATGAGRFDDREAADTWQCAKAVRPKLGILLPDGATLLLRREYRAFYRALVMSREGLLLDRAYHAARIPSAEHHTPV